MKTTNNIKRKIFKAAWKIYRRNNKKSFSNCLKSAWEWGKKNLLKAYSLWMPSDDFGRAYFSENKYIQFSVKNRAPKGYYERHRYCKGERFATAYYKLCNITLAEIEEYMAEIMYKIDATEMVASKF